MSMKWADSLIRIAKHEVETLQKRVGEITARRLASDPALRPLGGALFYRFCRDLYHNLREMGVTDLEVPKKMKGFAAAYFGRARAYEQALNSVAAPGCEAAIARNVFGQQAPGPGARRLAHYALYHAARGDFLEKLGRLDKAREAFAAALECPLNAAERAYLERKLAG